MALRVVRRIITRPQRHRVKPPSPSTAVRPSAEATGVDPEAVHTEEHHADADLPANFFALVLVRASEHAQRGGGGHLLCALGWSLLGLLLVLAEILCLWAVMFSSSYPACVKMDDCHLGTMCVQRGAGGVALASGRDSFLGDTMLATCEDCILWGNDYFAMVASAKSDSRWANGTTLEQYCGAQLASAAAEGLKLTNKTDFDATFCMYVSQNLGRVSQLGLAILGLVCAFLAASCAQERKQQICNAALRLEHFPICTSGPCRPACMAGLMPWRREAGAAGEEGASDGRDRPRRDARRTARSAALTVVALIFAITEVLKDCVLLPLVPAAMILLLLGSGLSADATLLNGVAVAFVIEVDDFAVENVLSYSQKVTLAHKLDDMARHGRPMPFGLHKLRAAARGLMVLIAMGLSIQLAREVNCDRIWNVVTRTTVRYVLFASAGVDTLLVLAHTLGSLPTVRSVAKAAHLRAASLAALKLVVYYLTGTYLFAIYKNFAWSVFYHGRDPTFEFSWSWNVNPFLSDSETGALRYRATLFGNKMWMPTTIPGREFNSYESYEWSSYSSSSYGAG